MTNKDDINFGRIANYLRDEDCPKTPQNIAKWTGIDLGDVYNVLQSNRAFFREIFICDELIGWTVERGLW